MVISWRMVANLPVSCMWGLACRCSGAMGNIRQLAPGEAGPSGLSDVHGVAHCLRPVDMAKLTDMEHEYRCEVACD